jgi:hypothetical protein
MTKITKAAFYEEFGSLDKIRISNLPVPELKEGEVLIRGKRCWYKPGRCSRSGRLPEFFYSGKFSGYTWLGCSRHRRRPRLQCPSV